jgi:hypothetical protein
VRSLALVVLLAACELEKVGIPRTESRVAMHSVLSASAPTQVVLLERTRNGSFSITAPPFDLADPVVTDEGIAESGATVSLTMPGAGMLVAREDTEARGDGKGRGIYRFDLPGSSLVRGATYRLTVLTTKGETLTAETSVPEGDPAVMPTQRVFDRVQDTVVLEWPAVSGARSYFVRMETPFGPMSFFTDSTRVRLTGGLRNLNLQALPHVFFPGFPQAVTVSAVDSNYYDWYRTNNDPFSGTGLINRVTGGLGVFGSLVRLRFESFEVTAPQVEAEAGSFHVVPEQYTSTLIPSLELYVESRAARDDQADALSGRYHKRPVIGQTGCLTCGLLGMAKDGRIELAMLGDWYAQDTADVFVGEIRGDTIVGSYRIAGGVLRYVRER